MSMNSVLVRGAVLACLLCCAVGFPAAAETGSVTVKQAAVKKSPRIFSATVATLEYADQVEVLERARGWTRVGLPDGKSGWLRDAHLNKPELALQAGTQKVAVAASDSELTLAGKGFDSTVENNYRQQNAEVDYTWIDRMESYRAGDGELNRFLQQGGLVARPGGGHGN